MTNVVLMPSPSANGRSLAPKLRDEADNHLIELAVADGADFIVTRNLRELQSVELRFDGLRVLSPDLLLQEL